MKGSQGDEPETKERLVKVEYARADHSDKKKTFSLVAAEIELEQLFEVAIGALNSITDKHYEVLTDDAQFWIDDIRRKIHLKRARYFFCLRNQLVWFGPDKMKKRLQEDCDQEWIADSMKWELKRVKARALGWIRIAEESMILRQHLRQWCIKRWRPWRKRCRNFFRSMIMIRL